MNVLWRIKWDFLVLFLFKHTKFNHANLWPYWGAALKKVWKNNVSFIDLWSVCRRTEKHKWWDKRKMVKKTCIALLWSNRNNQLPKIAQLNIYSPFSLFQANDCPPTSPEAPCDLENSFLVTGFFFQLCLSHTWSSSLCVHQSCAFVVADARVQRRSLHTAQNLLQEEVARAEEHSEVKDNKTESHCSGCFLKSLRWSWHPPSIPIYHYTPWARDSHINYLFERNKTIWCFRRYGGGVFGGPRSDPQTDVAFACSLHACVGFLLMLRFLRRVSGLSTVSTPWVAAAQDKLSLWQVRGLWSVSIYRSISFLYPAAMSIFSGVGQTANCF